MEVAYVAIDPGETSGWAKFDAAGTLLGMGQFTQVEQTKWLNDNITKGIVGVICEDYKNHANKRQTNWSRNQTSKNIGAIELICELREVPYFLQPNTVKAIGYKYAGLGQAPSNHAISHQYDAVAHGTYFLRVRNILKPIIPKD